jgi:hypothetical protein
MCDSYLGNTVELGGESLSGHWVQQSNSSTGPYVSVDTLYINILLVQKKSVTTQKMQFVNSRQK